MADCRIKWANVQNPFSFWMKCYREWGVHTRFWSLSVDWLSSCRFFRCFCCCCCLRILTHLCFRYWNAFSIEIIIHNTICKWVKKRKQCAPLIQINSIQNESTQKRNIRFFLSDVSLSFYRLHLLLENNLCSCKLRFRMTIWRWMNERTNAEKKINLNKLVNWNSNKIILWRRQRRKNPIIVGWKKKKTNECMKERRRKWYQQTYASSF